MKRKTSATTHQKIKISKKQVPKVVIEDPEEEFKPSGNTLVENTLEAPISARAAARNSRPSLDKESDTQHNDPQSLHAEQSLADDNKKDETAEFQPPLSARAARQVAIASGLYIMEEVASESESEEKVTDEDITEVRVDYDMEDEDLESLEEDNSENDESVEIVMSTEQDVTKEISKCTEMVYDSFSHFTSTNKNTCIFEQDGETYLFLGLRKDEDIVFMGNVYIAPVYGAVTVAGATLCSNRAVPVKAPEEDLSVHFYPVFCPRTHALLRISSVPLDTASVKSHNNPSDIDESLLEALYEEMDTTDLQTILVLKDLKDGMAGVHRVTGNYKNIMSFGRKEVIKNTSQKIQLLQSFHPVLETILGVKAFHTPENWETRVQIAMENEGRLVSLICGAKNQGKSTFGRYFINRLLSKYKKVAYIETDPGQAEFTPSGLVSLHYLEQPVLGPSFTHQQLEPRRSFFLGSNTARSNPNYYSACVRELFRHWEQEDEQIPLVVNTQGWISGVGYELLLQHIEVMTPTDVFMMRHPNSYFKNLPDGFENEAREAVRGSFGTVVMHKVDSCSNTTASLASAFDASIIRDLTLASYFHLTDMGVEAQLMPQWDFSKHQVERVPWVVDWRTSLNAIWVTYEEVKLEELLYALNGSIVGILGDVVDYKNQKGPTNTIEKEGFTPPRYLNTINGAPPQPEMTTCHGLAIVRAIDPSSHTLLLLTPLPAETLEKASCIVKGEIQLPSWALVDNVAESSGVAKIGWVNVPYVESNNGEGVGSKVLKIRRNLLRRK